MRLDRLRVAATITPTPAVAKLTVSPSAPGWKTIAAPVGKVTGEHDLFFTFNEQLSQSFSSSRIVAPEATDSRYLMSVDWLELREAAGVRPTPGWSPPRRAPRRRAAR